MATKCLHYKIIHINDTYSEGYQVKYKTGWFWHYIRTHTDAGSHIDRFDTVEDAKSAIRKLLETEQKRIDRRENQRGIVISGSLDV